MIYVRQTAAYWTILERVSEPIIMEIVAFLYAFHERLVLIQGGSWNRERDMCVRHTQPNFTVFRDDEFSTSHTGGAKVQHTQ